MQSNAVIEYLTLPLILFFFLSLKMDYYSTLLLLTHLQIVLNYTLYTGWKIAPVKFLTVLL